MNWTNNRIKAEDVVMITLLAKLLAALNSQSSSRQIALAIALGMIAGLTPMLSVHNVLILLFAFVIKVNFSAFFLAFGVFSGLGVITAAPFAALGETLLNDPSLTAFWTGLYQLTLLKIAHFHHTLTLGSLVVTMALFGPLFFISRWLIDRYRHLLQGFIEKLKVVQTLKSSRFYQIYLRMASKEQ
jgi:uncharacterized protein (TIGR03546 family)